MYLYGFLTSAFKLTRFRKRRLSTIVIIIFIRAMVVCSIWQPIVPINRTTTNPVKPTKWAQICSYQAPFDTDQWLYPTGLVSWTTKTNSLPEWWNVVSSSVFIDCSVGAELALERSEIFLRWFITSEPRCKKRRSWSNKESLRYSSSHLSVSAPPAK